MTGNNMSRRTATFASLLLMLGTLWAEQENTFHAEAIKYLKEDGKNQVDEKTQEIVQNLLQYIDHREYNAAYDYCIAAMSEADNIADENLRKDAHKRLSNYFGFISDLSGYQIARQGFSKDFKQTLAEIKNEKVRFFGNDAWFGISERVDGYEIKKIGADTVTFRAFHNRRPWDIPVKI
jgi:hypothetical protein